MKTLFVLFAAVLCFLVEKRGVKSEAFGRLFSRIFRCLEDNLSSMYLCRFVTYMYLKYEIETLLQFGFKFCLDIETCVKHII